MEDYFCKNCGLNLTDRPWYCLHVSNRPDGWPTHIFCSWDCLVAAGETPAWTPEEKAYYIKKTKAVEKKKANRRSTYNERFPERAVFLAEFKLKCEVKGVKAPICPECGLDQKPWWNWETEPPTMREWRCFPCHPTPYQLTKTKKPIRETLWAR